MNATQVYFDGAQTLPSSLVNQLNAAPKQAHLEWVRLRTTLSLAHQVLILPPRPCEKFEKKRRKGKCSSKHLWSRIYGRIKSWCYDGAGFSLTLLKPIVILRGRWRESMCRGSISKMKCTFGGLRPPTALDV